MSKRCPRCGNEEIADNHNFCMICGTKLVSTNQRVEEIKKRLLGATKGPWRIGKFGSVISDYPVPEMSGADAIEYYGGHAIAESITKYNAEFIANSWQDINFLLSVIEDYRLI